MTAGGGLAPGLAETSAATAIVGRRARIGAYAAVLLAFFEGRAAREASGLSVDERRRVVADCLARLFGRSAREPQGYVDKAWANEEWTRGCYGAFMPPGAVPPFITRLTSRVARMSSSGSPSMNAKSASLPTSIVPS